MRYGILCLSLIALSGCAQSKVAELIDRSNSYFGRNGATENGQSIARYSASHPASQSNDVAYKYKSQNYGVDAPVGAVEVSDLGNPTAKPAATKTASISSNSPFGKPSAPLTPEELGQASAEPAQSNEPSAATLVRADLTASAAPGPLAFSWPAKGKVISHFGPKSDGMSNDGINIAAKAGDPIRAAAEGEVAYVGNGLEGYGNLMILRHQDGWMSAYAHAKEFLLKKGDTVHQGDLLGYVGNTGSVKSPQLHFSLREGKTPIDPESVLNNQLATAAR